MGGLWSFLARSLVKASKVVNLRIETLCCFEGLASVGTLFDQARVHSIQGSSNVEAY
jgi:hypothetical protein